MRKKHPNAFVVVALVSGAATSLTACGGSDEPSLAAATPGTLVSCTDLATKAVLAGTTLTSTTLVASGGLTGMQGDRPVPEHCLVKGRMHERKGSDGRDYAIGFEMRLPTAWNGRYFYQANGGIDGSVVTATGPVGGGSPTTNALQMGFAVLSSDAGHSGPPWWGIDPQARLDYGYQAVGSLTPMAKNLIKTAYGKAPDRSYLGGCSNGGRHALVGAARYADQYDGILAGAPGFHLPKAAMAQMWKVQQYASIATSTVATGADAGKPDITSAVTPAEFKLLGDKIVAKCDALDGLSDGIVSDVKACQAVFNVNTDVPTCAAGARDGTYYLWGALGGAASLGLGLALAQPDRPVVVITGDGEQLMGIGSLATVGVKQPRNLTLVVLDNGHFGETGMQQSHSSLGTDLVAVARGFGIPDALSMDHIDGCDDVVQRIRAGAGTAFVQVFIEASEPPRALPPRDGPFIKNRFRAALGLQPF